ncbi:MAG: hypothetical protein M3081_00320 [Gemmatimonadota bacterium]|nr:hypothetical protein [Gemmatimonadota bacterium]
MKRVVLILCAATMAACGGGAHDSTSPAVMGTPCTAASSVPVSLQIGQVAVVSNPAQMNCMSVQGTAPTAEYMFVAANANTRPDVIWNYSVSAAAGTAASATVSPSIASDVVAAQGGSDAPPSFAEHLEAVRRAAEHQLPIADARALARQSPAARQAAPGVHYSLQAPPGVGDILTLRVPDSTKTPCTNFFTIGARVMAVSDHAIIAQDTLSPGGGFVSSDFVDIANEFDTFIFPTDTLHFGSPGDIDFNGKIIILFTPRVNAQTPRNSKSVLQGFFFGGDLFPRASCNESNIAELFYLLAPDPGAVFGDKRTTADVRQATRGTIAHEFQHMINLAVRIRESGASKDEATWLNEALSHLAEELVGRAEHGFSDLRKLTIADIDDEPLRNDFNAFFAQNLARFKPWLQRPDTAGATSAHADRSLAVRGAAWAIVRFSADQFAGGDVPTFTRRLVTGPDTGVANLAARSGVPFDSIMRGWMIANYASDFGVANLAPNSAYVSWNMRNVEAAISSGTYPLTVTSLADGSSVVTKATSGSGNYFRLAATPMTVRVRSTDGTLVTEPGARVYIVRTR